MTNKAEATEVAKQVLLEEFMLVGILEQLDDTLLALEALLPRYFKGALELSKSEDGMVYYIYQIYCDLCVHDFSTCLI